MEFFKVLVTGAFSSGKTEFIRSLSEIEVVSTELVLPRRDKREWAVAFDYGRLTVDDRDVIYFFGTPGALRVDIAAYWKSFERDFGIIFMIDSAKPETFREARALLDYEIIPSSLPYVVAVNKQDRPDAWDVEAIRIVLQLPPGVPMLTCCARNRETTKPVLIALFELWSKWDFDRVNQDETNATG